MADKVVTTLEQIKSLVERDLARFGLLKTIPDNNVTRRHTSDFVKYLISVASHPVGLRSSLSPFNSDQEHMLAYVMDIFSVNKNKLIKILSNSPNEKQVGKEGNLLIDRAKRHSWRPELRVRIHPPAFPYQNDDVARLHVRLYVFRDPNSLQHQTVARNELDSEGNILDRLLKRYRLNPSVLIRPVVEMKRLVKFEKISKDDSKSRLPRQLYQMVQIAEDGSENKDDVYINIRRYYCETQTLHILRLEFWLDVGAERFGLMESFRRKVKRAILFGGRDTDRSTYMNENQEFYGYININLNQVPSYASRQMFPVLSLRDKKLNSCEITIELKNRRIRQANMTMLNPSNKMTSQTFIINHVRLYSYCLMYHSRALRLSIGDNFGEEFELLQSLTIENLLYIPAFTLINQHRLQSNLGKVEDLCLRRVAILILLMETNWETDMARPIIISLISVLQNEYQLGNKPIDEKTKQEMDPFKDGSALGAASVFKLEALILENFVDTTLKEGMRNWLKDCGSAVKNLQHFIGLISLRLVKNAILYYRRADRGSATRSRSSFGEELRSRVQKMLCEMIIIHLKEKFDRIADLSRRSVGTLNQIEVERMWMILLRDMKYIDHDLGTYWSRKGLDYLLMRNLSVVESMNLFEALAKEHLKADIEAKIKTYVES